MTKEVPYVLITVYGGVADIGVNTGADIDILDFDDLKGKTAETVSLSDREWEYLKRHDRGMYNRLKGK